jgi:hypothetical protein
MYRNIYTPHIPDLYINHLIGVIVSVLVLGDVYLRFEQWSVLTKDYKIDICCFSANHTALRRKSKDWLFGISIMCLSEVDGISFDWLVGSNYIVF